MKKLLLIASSNRIADYWIKKKNLKKNFQITIATKVNDIRGLPMEQFDRFLGVEGRQFGFPPTGIDFYEIKMAIKKRISRKKLDEVWYEKQKSLYLF